MILILSCLVGIPPLPGFIGKFAVIGAAVSHEWYSLAVVAIISMILGTVSVFRLVFSLVGDFRTHRTEGERVGPMQVAVLAVLLGPLFILGIFAEQALGWAGRSLRFILW